MKFLCFIKKEVVFIIALLAAVISSVIVHPSKGYSDYINWDVIFILFSLMAIIAGFRICGVFEKSAEFLCKKVHTLRAVSFSLITLCFFFSMLITNDVALLTFVPFTIMVLSGIDCKRHACYLIVLETVAANLGSMLTPIGNPQNLFLYTKMNTSLLTFCSVLLPYTIFSFAVLCFLVLLIPSKTVKTEIDRKSGLPEHKFPKYFVVIYTVLFAMCLCCVFRIIPSWCVALVTLTTIFFLDKKLLLQVDYMLLLTFCAFFIFTGNMGNMNAIKTFLKSIVSGNEFWAGILSSQIISNVPAALLLEPFASSQKNLLLGVNVGGLGTLVASLASLISYKIYVNSLGKELHDRKYILHFTLISIVFLVPLCFMYFVIHSH